MRNLRIVAGDAMLDVYLGTMKLMEVEGEDGEVLYEHDSDQDLWQSKNVLSADDWQLAVNDSVAGKEPPLDRELLLNAQMFAWMKNYDMALVNTAIAAEMFLHRLVFRRLISTGKIFYFDPRGREWDNPAKLDHLLQNGIASTSTIDKLRQTFRVRNDIVHWRGTRLTTKAEVEDALNAAQTLHTLLRDN